VRIVGNTGSNSYSPNPFEAKVGETVTWVNDDSAVHTATSTDGTFDSNILQRGQTFSYTFDKEGEYSYSCMLHPNMAGTIIVTSS
jgi:plastocyanin